MMSMDCIRRLPVRSRHCRRDGAATLWILLSLPALLVVLLIVVDVGNVWVARAELENALEATALAAVREWGTASPAPGTNATNPARARGLALAAANHVRGAALAIDMNQGTFQATNNPNENRLCDPALGPPAAGNLVFGTISVNGMGGIIHDASNAPTDMYGVRAQASVPVASLAGSFLGLGSNPYAVGATVTALYDANAGQTRLVRVAQYICAPGNGAD